MRMDIYTKAVLTLLAVAFAVIALNPWIAPGRLQFTIPLVEAQPAAGQMSIPKDFGKVVGFTMGMLLLEAPDGTLREVVGPGPWPLGASQPGTVWVIQRR